jgi:hypothetical protein
MRRYPIAVAALLLAAVAGTVPAVADIQQPTVVSANPVDWTPHVLDGTVRAIAVVGDTVVVGGDFTVVSDHAEQSDYERWFLFAFGLRDGVIRDFAPYLDGPVYALAPAGPDSVYVGGAFQNVNGVWQRGLTQLQVSTGNRVASFDASINVGEVRTLVKKGSWLYAGGTFNAVNGVQRAALVRLDTFRGAVDAGFNARLAAPELSRTRVDDLAVSPDGRRLVVVGAITQASGLARPQLAMIDTSRPTASVADWYTDAYRGACDNMFETYLRGVDFAPDGSYFVAVATGRLTGPGRMCDTAARFEVAGAGRHNPTWVNFTGGDSLYAVSVTGSAVYVGGHLRWLDNPQGDKSAGPGAVSRVGIGAIDPRTGKALSWNPTRSRGVGVRAFVATPTGLLVGSDTDQLGHEYHGRLGMFPTR